MTGSDFFIQQTRPQVPTTGEVDQGQELSATDRLTHKLLGEILHELRAIHWHLAEMTENDPSQIRRDM